jgi:hypothetical protein
MSNKALLATVGLLCCLSVPVMAQQTGKANALSTSGATAGSNSSASSNVGTSASRATGGTGGSATGGAGGTASASGGNPNATATAGTASASTGPMMLNVYGTDPNAATGQPATGSASDPITSNNNVHYSGTTTIRNTPDVGSPAMYGGTNPCSVGVSAGLGLPGIGLSGGATWSDHGCERRNTAVILYQANKARVAEALLCQDKDTRAAFMAAGDPCPQDRTPVAEAHSAPVQMAAAALPVVAAPAVAPAAVVAAPAAPVQAPVVAAPARVTARAGYVGPKPAWCSSPVKDATEGAYHSYYCNG